MIQVWWEVNTPHKLKVILQAILLWELWKRRNARRHDKDINLYKLKQQCLNTVIHLIKIRYLR